jgi:hypothetical protein
MAALSSIGMIEPSDVAGWRDIGLAGVAIVACVVLYRDGKAREAKQDKQEERITQVLEKTGNYIAAHTEVARRCTHRAEERHDN